MKNRRFKDFGSGSPEPAEPIVFRLYEEDFECYAKIQGRTLLNLVAGSDEEDSASMARTMNGFFEAVLLPESRERFDALLNHPEKVVDIETLGEITAWLMEQYSERPTKRPELSSSGE
jgi:hypothetical protein